MVNFDSYCVYKHTTPNGKIYIGVTSQDPNRRWRNGLGYIDNRHFLGAISKYGWDNITHEILENSLSKEDACEKEQYYISLYKSNDLNFGYNKTSGGISEFEMSEESKQKMRDIAANEEHKRVLSERRKIYWANATPCKHEMLSESCLERWKKPGRKEKASEQQREIHSTPEMREKYSEIAKKRWANPEYRMKNTQSLQKSWKDPEQKQHRVESMLASTQTDEYREKMKISSKTLWQTPEFRAKTIKAHKSTYVCVRCRETGVVYSSMTEAARAVKGYAGGISKSCKTGYLSAGFHWEYAEEVSTVA